VLARIPELATTHAESWEPAQVAAVGHGSSSHWPDGADLRNPALPEHSDNDRSLNGEEERHLQLPSFGVAAMYRDYSAIPEAPNAWFDSAPNIGEGPYDVPRPTPPPVRSSVPYSYSYPYPYPRLCPCPCPCPGPCPRPAPYVCSRSLPINSGPVQSAAFGSPALTQSAKKTFRVERVDRVAVEAGDGHGHGESGLRLQMEDSESTKDSNKVRRERNRISAKSCRKRKKHYVQSLEEEVRLHMTHRCANLKASCCAVVVSWPSCGHTVRKCCWGL
jgi:hypothetical protein